VKLKTQILALGLSGAFAAAVAAVVGLATSSQLAGVLDAAIVSGETLQASQQGDMMHDAIRGDAQLALVGALEKNDKRFAAAEAGLAEHARIFEQSLDRMEKGRLSDESRQALAAARPAVRQYAESARATIAAARVDLPSAYQAADDLQQRFEALEKQLAALSTSVEKNGAALNAETTDRLRTARLALAAVLALTTAAMVLASLWLAGRMTRPMRQAVAAADRLAQGDLGVRIEPAGNDETRALMGSMARMREQLADIVRRVKANADQVATASAQIADGNQDLSNRTEQQASALQQTASTMQQLGGTLVENAQSARQANDLVQGTSAVATRGGATMGQVVDTMKGINESSRRIGDIIGVIDGIAFQTNILALNAAVEAARAGEQGRGFAVVASEVRSLAQRSADAAREIKTLISASVERVEHGSTLVDEAGRTMEEIVASIGRVTDIVGAISAASAEQSEGVGRVGEAIVRMDQGTQQNAALVEQSAAAADSLRQQSAELVQSVSAFRLDDGAA
jgi:methyl-accepting chemotaxis protein